MTETETRYLIVGGGMTGDAACKGIREHDPDGDDHARRLRARTRRTRARRCRRGSGRAATRRRSGAAPTSSTSTCTSGGPIVSVDADARVATDDAGRRVPVRAAPARDRRPAAAPARRRRGGRRLLPHARRLPARTRSSPQDGARFVVIGGGFIGSEIAAALTLERLPRDDGLPRPRDLRASLPGRAVRVRHRLLPGEGRRGAHRRDASRAWRTAPCARSRGTELDADGDRRRARHRAGDRARCRDRARPSTTASSSTSSAGPAGETTCSPPATSPASRSPRSATRRASSTRTTRTRTARSSARTWPAPGSPTTTCRSSTPTCSTSATRRSATSTRASGRSRTGRSRTARA